MSMSRNFWSKNCLVLALPILRWDDIDFDAKRITVTVPKLAHLEGKATRTIPLFPALQELLTTAYKLREGARVVTLAPDASKNFRTRFARIITRAGVDPWPKLFHTLRACGGVRLQLSGLGLQQCSVSIGQQAVGRAERPGRSGEGDHVSDSGLPRLGREGLSVLHE